MKNYITKISIATMLITGTAIAATSNFHMLENKIEASYKIEKEEVVEPAVQNYNNLIEIDSFATGNGDAFDDGSNRPADTTIMENGNIVSIWPSLKGWTIYSSTGELLGSGTNILINPSDGDHIGETLHLVPQGISMLPNGNVLVVGYSDEYGANRAAWGAYSWDDSSKTWTEDYSATSTTRGYLRDSIALANGVTFAVGKQGGWISFSQSGRELKNGKVSTNYDLDYLGQFVNETNDGRVSFTTSDDNHFMTGYVDEDGNFSEYKNVDLDTFPGAITVDQQNISQTFGLSNGNMYISNKNDDYIIVNDLGYDIPDPDGNDRRAYEIINQGAKNEIYTGPTDSIDELKWEETSTRNKSNPSYGEVQFDNDTILTLGKNNWMWLQDENGNTISQIKNQSRADNSWGDSQGVRLMQDGTILLYGQQQYQLAIPTYDYSKVNINEQETTARFMESFESDEHAFEFGTATYNDVETSLRESLVAYGSDPEYDSILNTTHEPQFDIPYLDDPSKTKITFYEDDLTTEITDKTKVWDVAHVNFKLSDIDTTDDLSTKTSVTGETEVMTISMEVPIAFRTLLSSDASQTKLQVSYEMTLPQDYILQDVQVVEKNGETFSQVDDVETLVTDRKGTIVVDGLDSNTTYDNFYLKVSYTRSSSETDVYDNFDDIESAKLPSFRTLTDEIHVDKNRIEVITSEVPEENWLQIDENGNYRLLGEMFVYDDATNDKVFAPAAEAKLVQVTSHDVTYDTEPNVYLSDITSTRSSHGLKTVYNVEISGNIMDSDFEKFANLQISLNEKGNYISLGAYDQDGIKVINYRAPEDPVSSHRVMYIIIVTLLLLSLLILMVVVIIVVKKHWHHH